MTSAAAPMRGEQAAQREPRWLVRRRAEAAAAMVATEAAPRDQACLLYNVSVIQFEACRRAAERWLGRDGRTPDPR